MTKIVAIYLQFIKNIVKLNYGSNNDLQRLFFLKSIWKLISDYRTL